MKNPNSKITLPTKLRAPGGFALIVTLLLMILLSIVILGMLSLSSVVLRSSSQDQAMATAQSNAKLALMIAIGDLQKAAGPDQRVTTTANIAAAQDGAMLPAGVQPENNNNFDNTAKGLSSVLPGTRHWTGVFSNRDQPNDIYTKTPALQLQRWLVSGTDDGLPSSLTPADPRFIVNTSGIVSDPDAAILLVGQNTAGADIADYVVAPKVMIPASPGGNPEDSGAFAYWIGDEGVKAKINQNQTLKDSDYASLVAQRRGWETVDKFSNYPLPPADSDFKKVITLDCLELLSPKLDAGATQSVFHAATTDSSGLLTNTQDGGMRVDLTALLSANTLPATLPSDGYDNHPVTGGRVIPESLFTNLGNLTWDHIQDFYLTSTGNPNGTSTLTVRGVTSNKNAITPSIIDLRILLGFALRDHQEDPGNANYFTAIPKAGAKIAVTLSNPYSVPISWNQMIELEIENHAANPTGEIMSLNRRRYTANPNPVTTGSRWLPRLLNGDRNGAEAAVFYRTIFQIPSGTLQPGEARAYTISAPHLRPRTTARFVVGMQPVAPDTIFNYNNWVELESTSRYTFNEHGVEPNGVINAPVIVNMRLASGEMLCKLTDLELANPHRVNHRRRPEKSQFFFGPNHVNNIDEPLPLVLYKFQLSYPGTDYLVNLPPGYSKGQRGSSLRTFADFNLRASHFSRTIASYVVPPFFLEINDSLAGMPYHESPPGGLTGTGFTKELVSNPLYWGFSQIQGADKAVLYSFPGQFVSLAQLQHADLTHDEIDRSIAHQPGNAFGNSYATPFVKRSLTSQTRGDYDLNAVPEQVSRKYFDMSYLINTALWDRYFFSTIPNGTTIPNNPTLLPNPTASVADINDPQKSASHLMIDGAFNINSTSKDAWKAFLGSSRFFKHPADAVADTAAFPRSLQQPYGHAEAANGDGNHSFSGYRRITDAQLDALATEMVRQVRLRGPFISLAHFTNRALANITDEPELTRSGALQTALDESGVNISIDGNANGLGSVVPDDNRVTLELKQGRPRADYDGTGTSGRPADADPTTLDWAATALAGNFRAVASIVADREMLVGGTGGGSIAQEQGYRSTGIPGWVTQADVLQVIGSAVSARSDTFRIRTAGQCLDASGKVRATAYAEAIVQRMPEFIDSTDPAEKKSGLTQTNQTFGRKFEIVSFRWLSPNEI
ncbi:MAG: hypothetical protein V4727_00960 [Verrucomicrobiota bacterium]